MNNIPIIILTTMLRITSDLFIANILPNIKLHTSVFSPVVNEVATTPIAKAELDIRAIQLSLFILLLFPILSKRIAHIVTPWNCYI